MVDVHWADVTASRIIKENGDKKKYVCASGVTPSGFVHMGNFREAITTHLVVKALQEKGKNADFIYSWDDYDRFRKVPEGLPKELEKYIGVAVGSMPDPFKCHKSYAEHFEKKFEDSIKDLGFTMRFIRQIEPYQKCIYAHDIRLALRGRDKIRKVLDKYRKYPLDSSWMPAVVYCEKCGKDNTKILKYDEEYKIKYKCVCGHTDEIDFRKKGLVKLKWRVDWPARWAYYHEDFEPCGKDHSAAGGSWQTSKEIIKDVWELEGPTKLFYEWIGIKGGKKFKKSKGITLMVSDVLDIYEPEIVRWLFVNSRPNAEFSMSFDLDVLKIYEDFDICERIYYGKEKIINKKELLKQKRIYELSHINEVSKEMPEQVGFRHLTTLLQIHEGNIEEATKSMSARTKLRAKCALNWIKKYAPEEMKFSVNKAVSNETKTKLNGKQKKSLQVLCKRLDKEYDSDSLFNEFYNICQEVGIKNTDFFTGAYLVLIGKEKGPRLSNFILTLGKDRVKELLNQI